VITLEALWVAKLCEFRTLSVKLKSLFDFDCRYAVVEER